jgi:hypothetical protein
MGAGCPRNLANYAAPYYLVNVTGLVGSVPAAPPVPPAAAITGAWGEVTAVTGGNATAAAGPAQGQALPLPVAATAALGEAAAESGAVLGAQQAGSGTLT